MEYVADMKTLHCYLGAHPPGGDLVVVSVPVGQVLGALGQESPDVALVLEDQVEVASGRRGDVPAGPLHSHLTEL